MNMPCPGNESARRSTGGCSPTRGARAGLNDAALLDEALSALLARHRAAEIDAAYAAYGERPLAEADEWGDLASFRNAAARS
jgi:hypothetical protein